MALRIPECRLKSIKQERETRVTETFPSNLGTVTHSHPPQTHPQHMVLHRLLSCRSYCNPRAGTLTTVKHMVAPWCHIAQLLIQTCTLVSE